MFPSKTYVLKRTQLIPRSRAETFRFFEDATNLQKITPKDIGFEILTPAPIEMREGTLIDYRIRLSGIPLRWRTLIESYDPPNRFVDVQLKGPYKLWHHTHEFHETDDGTLMTDVVRYQLRFAPFSNVVNAIYVARALGKIFDYRTETIKDHFQS